VLPDAGHPGSAARSPALPISTPSYLATFVVFAKFHFVFLMKNVEMALNV